MVVPSITNYQPTITFEPSEWKFPGNINLADPSLNKHCRIDLLIGAELFLDLMSISQVKLASHLSIVQKTQLGWVVSGGGLRSHQTWSLAVTVNTQEDAKLSDVIKGFYKRRSVL